MSLLTVEHLDVRLGGRRVLSDISVAVPEGGLVTILGRNGVGKTTLLRTVSGLYRPAGGRIAIAGAEIGGLPPHRVVRAGVAQAPEGRQLFGDMDVIENLRAGALHLSRADFERRVAYVSGLFPIVAERRAQAAGSLSGGEQQMVCIARSLMGSPRLLLLDEPSLGLAPLVAAEIFRIVAELNEREGTAVLLVEQNARSSLAIAQRAYVLEVGEVAFSGTSDELSERDAIRKSYLGY